MPKLFRWFGRLRPTQPTPDTADDLPWQDRVDHVRALMDAFAPPPQETDTAKPEEPTATSNDHAS